MFAILTLILTGVVLQTTAVPAEWSALWLAATGALTALVTQGLKHLAAPLARAPDIVKATVAFVVAFLSVKGAALLGVPIPPTLAGFAGVLVSWASAMGLHALAKALGVITDGA